MERTLVILKPDAVQRALVGEIIRRLECRGFNIVAMKLMRLSTELAKRHYAAHREKPFFASLIEYITSGPVVVMIIEGQRAIEIVRQMMGATDPAEAAPGTIRGDLALDKTCNLIHGSDSREAAEMEIELFFSPAEIVSSADAH